MRDAIRFFGFGMIAGIILAGLACAGWTLWTAPSRTVAQLAPTSPKVAKIDKVTRDCKTVEVFADRAKKKLDLPEHVQKDEHASVLAAAPVPVSDYPRTATAILHRDTGIGEIYLRDDPLPWLAIESRWRLGAWYGVNDEQGGAIRAHARYEVAQTKRLHWSLLGSVETGGRFFAGVGGEFH